jgi:hypothetical protein
MVEIRGGLERELDTHLENVKPKVCNLLNIHFWVNMNIVLKFKTWYKAKEETLPGNTEDE